MSKNKSIITIILLMLFPVMSLAQNKVISVPQGTPMYRLSKKYTSDTLYCVGIFNDIDKAKIVYTETPMELPFIGCSSRESVYAYNTFHSDIGIYGHIYDMYIVSYKGKQWGVFAEYVDNPQYIDSLNWALFSQKLDEYEAKANSAYCFIQDLAAIAKDEQDKELQSDSLSLKFYMNQLDSLNSILSYSRESMFDSIFKECQNESQVLCKQLSPNAQISLNSILIESSSLTTSNSVGGHDAIVTYLNLYDKDIKYFRWSGYAKNNVDDEVYCEVRNTKLFHAKDVGPIKQFETGGGTWENVIYNYTAKNLILESIFVEYMDGHLISIGEKDLSIIKRMKVFSIPNTKSFILVHRNDIYVYGDDIPEPLMKYSFSRSRYYVGALGSIIDEDSRIVEIQEKISAAERVKRDIEKQIERRLGSIAEINKVLKLKKIKDFTNAEKNSEMNRIGMYDYRIGETIERFIPEAKKNYNSCKWSVEEYFKLYKKAIICLELREKERQILIKQGIIKDSNM